MELDPIGKYQVRKLRKDQAKDLKTVRKTSNKLMSGLPGHRNAVYDLAQDAAKKTREEAVKKIKEGSKKRIKIGKRAAAVGTLVGGGYALNKLMKDEKLYSLILTESQLQRLYSKMEDQDYLDEQEQRKESVKHAKGLGTATGALVGAGLGHSLGRGKGKLVGAAAGAVGGGVLGRYAGKSIKKSTEKDADKKINTYKNASEHDKKYLREKNEKEKDRRIQERQARAMENTAWHTSRWYSIHQGLNQKEFSETEPDIWREYKEKINPEIDKLEKSINYNVFFCHALNEIEEDPTNKGYFLMFDTVPGLKWKDGDYYINKSSFFGLGKEKLTKISRSEALKYLGGRFCTTDDPFKLAKDRRVEGIYNKILSL